MKTYRLPEQEYCGEVKPLSKYVIPVVIVLLVLLFLAGYGLGILSIPDATPSIRIIKTVFIIGIGILSIGLIMVLIQRFKEIKGGNEDDLGKY
jgi:hypothetical protein